MGLYVPLKEMYENSLNRKQNKQQNAKKVHKFKHLLKFSSLSYLCEAYFELETIKTAIKCTMISGYLCRPRLYIIIFINSVT